MTNSERLALGLIIIGVLSRLIPHPPNVTAVVGVSLLGAYAIRSPWLAALVPVVVMALADIVRPTSMSFRGTVLVAASAVILSSVLSAQSPQTAPGAPQAPGNRLPVHRVVLYKSGVGYFEHLGRVRGNQTVTVDFTSGQLDDVLKSLTTIDAPSYSLPAAVLGEDWGSVAAGVSVDVTTGVKVVAKGTADFGDSDTVLYGGQLGLNIAF